MAEREGHRRKQVPKLGRPGVGPGMRIDLRALQHAGSEEKEIRRGLVPELRRHFLGGKRDESQGKLERRTSRWASGLGVGSSSRARRERVTAFGLTYMSDGLMGCFC